MASLSVQISQAVEARLKLAEVMLPSGPKNPPAGLQVERERLSVVAPFDLINGPMLVVSIGAETRVSRSHRESPKTDRTLELLVGVYALATSIKGAEATDPAYVWLIHALQYDQRLGGLALYLSEEGYDTAYTTFQDSAEIVCAREVKIHVRLMTRTDDPEVRSN